MYWLISANSKIYDHTSSFEHYGSIDWKQGQINYAIGDIVYIYCTRPTKKIRYKCEVQDINLNSDQIRDDKEYWKDLSRYEKSLSGLFMHLSLISQVDLALLELDLLKENGLKSAPQGPMKIDGKLLNYIEMTFTDNKQNDFFPEMINDDAETYEGIKTTTVVNRFERSSIARAKCIEYSGTSCCICGLDFTMKYGEIGKGFIHVHHLTPLHEINENYKVDYKNDLRPVCPNCHAMLHRTINGESVSIERLKKILQSRNQEIEDK